METQDYNQTNDISEIDQSQPNMDKNLDNKKIIFVILGFIVVLFMIGMISYYLGIQKANSDQELAKISEVEPSASSVSNIPLETKQPTYSPKTIVPSEKPIIDETSGWKEYTESREVKFSISYPSTWILDTKDGMFGEKGARFDSGKERIGGVAVGWNSEPVEPNCNKDSQKIEIVQIKNRTIKMCHFTGSNQEPEGYFYNSTFDGVDYSIVTGNYPGEENKQVILKILSTLEILE